jgi:hypothetical protein
MNMTLIKSLASCALIMAPMIVVSDEAKDDFKPGWYWAGSLGKADAKSNTGAQSFNYLNVGGHFGYRHKDFFALEFLATFASDDDKDDVVSQSISNAGTKFDALAVYAVFQNPGDFYAKGKFGLAQSRFSYTAPGYEDETKGSVGFSWGAGVGIKVEAWRVELEYMVFPKADDPLFSEESYDPKLINLSIGSDF